MLIMKTNAFTVQCDISVAELREIGLTPTLVVSGDKRTEAFMKELSKEIEKQLGFDPHSEVLIISKNLLDDGNLRILVEKLTDTDIEGVVDRLKRAANSTLEILSEDAMHHMREKGGMEKVKVINDMLQKVMNELNSIYTADEEEPETPADQELILERQTYLAKFHEMNSMIRFCKFIDRDILKTSRLYKYKDFYALIFKIEATDERKIYTLQQLGLEYADELLLDSSRLTHIEEAGNCLIAEDAIKKMGDFGKNTLCTTN